jgi:predicted ATPase
MSGSTSEFGVLLRNLRKARGWSQKTLGDRAKLSDRCVADLEAGRRRAPYQATVRRLADALKLSPSDRAAFEAAVDRRRSGREAGLAPTEVEGLPTLSSAGEYGEQALIGRGREMQELEAFLASPSPRVLSLVGEAGIGKSRLVTELAGRAAATGWGVIKGTCQQHGVEEPFAALAASLARYLVRQRPATRRAMLEGCQWLIPLMPQLAEAGLLAAPADLVAPQRARWLMFDAVGRFLANIAGPAGTLLLLDDVQWASSDAVALLSTLLNNPAVAHPRPLRVVLSYRGPQISESNPLFALLADLARLGHITRLDLGPLSSIESAELLKNRLGDRLPIDADQLADLVTRTGGVPFFLVCFAHAYLAESQSPLRPRTGLPWTIAETIRLRVAALPDGGQPVLQSAAVIGREIPYRLLARVVRNGADPELVTVLETAAAEGLIEYVDDGKYRFTHDLIHEALYENLGKQRRRLLHGLVADALCDLFQDHPGWQPAEIAYHYSLSDQPERALPHLLLAAAAAASSGALDEQANLLTRALTIDQRNLPAAQKAELLGQRGRALQLLNRTDEALTDYRAAVADLDTTSDLLQQVRTWITELEANSNPDHNVIMLSDIVARTARRGPAASHRRSPRSQARQRQDPGRLST